MMYKLFNKIIEPVYSRHQFSHIISANNETSDVDLEAGQTYFRLRLSEMFLRERSILGQSYVPRAVSVTSFKYAGGDVQVPVVVSSNSVAESIGHSVGSSMVVFENTNLVGPVPFGGGDIELFIALFKSETDHLMTKSLTLLEEVTSAFGANLAPYTKIAEKVSSGVIGFINGSPEDAILAYKVNITKNMFREKGDHFLIFIDCLDEELDKENLIVRDGKLYQRISGGGKKRFEGASYCLVKFEIRSERDDYRALPFYPSYTEMLKRVERGDMVGAKDYFFDLKMHMHDSPDLTEPHKKLLKAHFVKEVARTRDESKIDDDVFRGARSAVRGARSAVRGAGALPQCFRAWLSMHKKTISLMTLLMQCMR